MFRPTLRISLATALVIVAVLGPGTGLAIRWRNEWLRTKSQRMMETELRRIQQESLTLQLATLMMLEFHVDNAPEMTSHEREIWARRIQSELAKVRQAATSERSRVCYVREDGESP